MKLKKLAGVIAVAAALGVGTATQAHAGALAQGEILISDFIISNGSGTALSLSDFSTLTFTDTLTTTAQLNGTAAPQGLAVSNGTWNGTTATGFVASTDALQACVGTCPGQNFWTLVIPPPSATFARSDSILSNQPIVVGGFTTGVIANTVGETSLTGSAFGSSASDIILNSTFSFVLAHAVDTLGLRFMANDLLRAWTSPGSQLGTSAAADIKWEITLKDGNTTLLDWLPDGNIATGAQTGLTVTQEGCDLNNNASATFNDPQSATVTCTGGLFAANTTFDLLTGHSYSFAITQHVTSQAVSVAAVPEPSTLALLGLGLGSIGFLGLRRRSKS